MFLPIKTKNPPESTPYATFALIGINILVFICTSNGLTVREEVVKQFALTHANAGPLTLLSSMFLHGDILHIAGNMWFLWLLGAAVEGRLKTLKYLLVYFASGLTGDGLHLLATVSHADVPSLGASGAIMGLMGAALWMFPHSKMKIFYWFGIWWYGVWEWRMWGVALYYLVWDNVLPALIGFQDGVAHFAHLGGALGGFVVALALCAKRDDATVSDAKSELSESSDLRALTRLELSKLAGSQPDNQEVALAWMSRSLEYGNMPQQDCVDHFLRHSRAVSRSGDVDQAGSVILQLSDVPGRIPAQVLFDMAVRLEKEGRPQMAVPLFERCLKAPDCNDSLAESATFRLGMVQEAWFQNHAKALELFQEFVVRWPMSPMEGQVKERIRVLQAAVGRANP